MTILARIPELNRVRFEHGQSLSARDLTEMQNNITQLRWLQNRMFHGWGIVSGLNVTNASEPSELTVSAGFALDYMGREILMPGDTTLAIPTGGDSGGTRTLYLVVSYREDAKQQVLEKRASACLPGGSVRLSNDADLGWRVTHGLRRGRDIVLARVAVRRCAVVARIDLSVRRQVPICKGRSIGSGRSARVLDWRRLAGVSGISAYIDTSSAGFERTPTYRTELLGERTMSDGIVLLVPFMQVREESATGFTLDVMFPNLGDRRVNPKSVRNNPVDAVRKLGWRFDWVGVEQ